MVPWDGLIITKDEVFSRGVQSSGIELDRKEEKGAEVRQRR